MFNFKILLVMSLAWYTRVDQEQMKKELQALVDSVYMWKVEVILSLFCLVMWVV